MANKEIECDSVVIGAGSAGIEAYREISCRGNKCVIIDPGPLGTTAQRSGEIPISILMSAGLAVHAGKRLADYGISTSEEVSINTSQVLNSIRIARSRTTSEVLSFMYRIPEELRLHGRARFTDANTISVSDSVDSYRVHFTTAVICTGTSPLVTYEQSRLPEVITSNEFFDLKELPESAAVFGGSAVGLQLGQALSYLGKDVVLFGQKKLWNLTDSAVLNVARDMLSARFKMVTDSFITAIEPDSPGYSIYYVDEWNYENYLHMDSVIAATGRIPNVGGMNLHEIGVKLTRRGQIIVDKDTMQSSVPHIFAAGGVTMDEMNTSLAKMQGRYAGINAVTYPKLSLMPKQIKVEIVYTDPILAIVGKSLDEMKSKASIKGSRFIVSEVRMNNSDYRAQHDEGGIISMYVDPRTRLIEGAEICAAGGDHIAQSLAFAIRRQMTVDELATFSFFHLSCESVIAQAAEKAVSLLGRMERL
ncbi:MAG TPA: hypothetical protein DCR21_02140 [Succinivibrionaceae bacterium]|nr:FAD-dependent oxidoreductase [Succinivibrio sp.]HAR79607.1 hypothetical protein [Succinivibrionaceae bacterium]